MKVEFRPADNRTLKNDGVRSLFDTEVNIKIRVLVIIALAGTIGNTLGFLANLFLYGFNFVTGFCAFCAALMILYLLVGLRSSNSVLLGYAMLFILDVLEFPLLTLTYGAVMYPYMIIGFHGLAMITDKVKRVVLCVALGLYDIAIIVYSSIHPYIFGPQDSIGLMGSAIITFAISIVTVASLVVMWQNVYLVDTIEIDSVTKTQSQIGFTKNAAKLIQSDTATDYLLLYFNVCSLKTLNSVWGIEGGNRFLHSVADRLIQSSFSPRLVGRLNADRFVCLIDKKNFNAEALNDLCQMSYAEDGREINVLLNCGVYPIENRYIPITSMIDRASTALRFIHSGGNKFYAEYSSSVEAKYNEETVVLAEIDQAINSEQFCPFYQPVVDCASEKIVSAEALARWIHPQLGLVSPAAFIPILEKKNLISNLDSIMFNSVSNLILNRLDKHNKMVPISINLSREDLYDHSFMQGIQDVIRTVDERNCMYRFEITESAYENMSEYIINVLSGLRKNKAEILVDDFGSGYSSLGMITDYEFDIIKLDMQFARKITENSKIPGVIQSLVDMAHKLGAKIIAEGVETREEFEIIKASGCDYVQGYLFYKPMSEEDFIAALEAQN